MEQLQYKIVFEGRTFHFTLKELARARLRYFFEKYDHSPAYKLSPEWVEVIKENMEEYLIK